MCFVRRGSEAVVTARELFVEDGCRGGVPVCIPRPLCPHSRTSQARAIRRRSVTFAGVCLADAWRLRQHSGSSLLSLARRPAQARHHRHRQAPALTTTTYAHPITYHSPAITRGKDTTNPPWKAIPPTLAAVIYDPIPLNILSTNTLGLRKHAVSDRRELGEAPEELCRRREGGEEDRAAHR